MADSETVKQTPAEAGTIVLDDAFYDEGENTMFDWQFHRTAWMYKRKDITRAQALKRMNYFSGLKLSYCGKMLDELARVHNAEYKKMVPRPGQAPTLPLPLRILHMQRE